MKPLNCRGDIFDASFDSQIDFVKFQIIFPSLKILKHKNGLEHNLIVDKPHIMQSARKDDWGSINIYNSNGVEDRSQIGACINQVVMTCQFSNDADYNLGVEKISEGINAWRTQFYERINILNKSPIDSTNMDYFERFGKATGIELYNEQDYSKVQLKSVQAITVFVSQIEKYLIPDEIRQILATIDVSKNLKNEYNMYLNAIIELNKRNTRFAILEATTAVELCVIQKIHERCNELGINGKGLSDMFYRSLGDRFNMLNHLKIELATDDPKNEIVKPRNNLFHNRTLIPTVKESLDILEAVKAYLDAYIPNMYE